MHQSFAETKRLSFSLSPEFELTNHARRTSLLSAHSIMSSLRSSPIYPYFFVYL